MSDTILAVCAHADDEAYGLAGTLARHADAGDRVELLFMADGVTARHAVPDPVAASSEIEARREMARRAANAVGARAPRFLDLPDNRLDQVAMLDLAKAVERHVAEVAPSIIYTNHANDLNVDHRLTHQAVLTACRPLPGSPVRAIYAFETLSSTEWEPAGGVRFQPNRYVNIAGFTDRKLAAVRAYDREMREFPHPRSLEAIEALWRLRGAQSGFMSAEALVVVRELS